MKILFEIPSLGVGGPQRWVETLLPYISESHEVAVFSYADPGNSVCEYEFLSNKTNIRVYLANFSSNILVRNLQIITASQLSSQLLSSFDVIHANSDLWSGPILKKAKSAGVPVRIIHARNTLPTNVKMLEAIRNMIFRYYIRSSATARLAVSREAFASFFGHEPDQEKGDQVIPSALDSERIQNLASNPTEYLNLLSPYGNCFIHVGRFHRQKNHLFLLKIFAAIKKVRPDSCLALIGVGELPDWFHFEAKKLGVYEKIIPIPPCDNVYSIMKQCADLLIFPSLWEGTPRVVAEAQICGLPVLCSEATTQASCFSKELFHQISLTKNETEWAETAVRIVERLCTKKKPLTFSLPKIIIARHQASYLTSYYQSKI